MESENNQIISSGPQNLQITAQEFGSKYRGKKDIWILLTQSGIDAYLPPYHSITIYFMRDLLSGRRKFIKNTQVRMIFVPQYETLTQEIILKYIKQYPDIYYNYLPEKEVELKKLPKTFCAVLANSLIPGFKSFVEEKVNERHQKVKQLGMLISVDKDVHQAFQDSQAVTTNHGRSYQLLKVGSKRRVGKYEKIAIESEKQVRQQEIDRKLQQFEEMVDKINTLEQEMANQDGAKVILENMLSEGKLVQNADGTVELSQQHMHQERSSLS